MSRISRIFGRKDDQPSGEEDNASDQEVTLSSADTADQDTQRPPIVPELPDQDFGLKFVFSSGDSKTFTSLPILIGRSEQNDIVVNDETVSAVHARVCFDEQLRDICILDNGSLNGLFIDGQPTRKNILYDGVRIGLGSTEITFRDTGYIHSG